MSTRKIRYSKYWIILVGNHWDLELQINILEYTQIVLKYLYIYFIVRKYMFSLHPINRSESTYYEWIGLKWSSLIELVSCNLQTMCSIVLKLGLTHGFRNLVKATFSFHKITTKTTQMPTLYTNYYFIFVIVILHDFYNDLCYTWII